MRKSAFFSLLTLALLALSLPATKPTRSSQMLGVPVLPFSPYGIVQYNGFNLPACNDEAGCPDVQAHCGSFTFSNGEIILDSGKSWYSMQIPFDDPDTPAKDGCVDNEEVTFTIKGEPADQPATPWLRETSMQYDLSFGSPNMVFLPLIQR